MIKFYAIKIPHDKIRAIREDKNEEKQESQTRKDIPYVI